MVIWKIVYKGVFIFSSLVFCNELHNPIVQAALADMARRKQFFLFHTTKEGFGGFLKYPGFLPPPEPFSGISDCLEILKSSLPFLDRELLWSYFDTGSTRGGYVVTTVSGERIEYPFLEFSTYGTATFQKVDILKTLLGCHLQETLHLDSATFLKVSVGYAGSPANHGYGVDPDDTEAWSGWFVYEKQPGTVRRLSLLSAKQLEPNWWVLLPHYTSEEIFECLGIQPLSIK